MIQKDLDIAEYTDPDHDPMIPHVIVLELGLVTRKCRPDWDTTMPELMAAWSQRRKELFYPYGKTYAQTLGEQD